MRCWFAPTGDLRPRMPVSSCGVCILAWRKSHPSIDDGQNTVAYPSLSCAVAFVQTKLQACSLAGTEQVKRHLTWRGNPKGKTAWLVKRRILSTGLRG